MDLTFGSVFAGIGGFDLGFSRAGLRCQWHVEINRFCQRVLCKRFPDAGRWDDARTFPPAPARNWRVDVICGGDPCQANSAAVGGGRSTFESLGGEFVRIVDVLRPRFVVRENPAHIRKGAPWPWWRMRSALESLGYAVLPFKLRACCFGHFHQRERVLLLGELADPHGVGLAGWEEETQSWNAGQSAGRIHAGDWLTLSASRGLRSRAGFPDYVDRVTALGNSFVPQCAEWIGERLIRYSSLKV